MCKLKLAMLAGAVSLTLGAQIGPKAQENPSIEFPRILNSIESKHARAIISAVGAAKEYGENIDKYLVIEISEFYSEGVMYTLVRFIPDKTSEKKGGVYHIEPDLRIILNPRDFSVISVVKKD